MTRSQTNILQWHEVSGEVVNEFSMNHIQGCSLALSTVTGATDKARKKEQQKLPFKLKGSIKTVIFHLINESCEFLSWSHYTIFLGLSKLRDIAGWQGGGILWKAIYGNFSFATIMTKLLLPDSNRISILIQAKMRPNLSSSARGKLAP